MSDPLQRKSIGEYFAIVSEQFGQRPSFVTFERDADGPGRIFTRIGFYRATIPEAAAQVKHITADSSDAEAFAIRLKADGYEQQPLALFGKVAQISFAAPESVVVDIHPLGVLIPRGAKP